jgi:hypothetical protein
MKSIVSRLSRYLESLRFPWLLLLASLLFVVNLFIPDALPFIDEILLAIVAIILGKLKRKPENGEQATDQAVDQAEEKDRELNPGERP